VRFCRVFIASEPFYDPSKNRRAEAPTTITSRRFNTQNPHVSFNTVAEEDIVIGCCEWSFRPPNAASSLAKRDHPDSSPGQEF
jgi:hypothetical protein